MTTHATIRPASATGRITVDFAYDERAKDAVKALPGADFDGLSFTAGLMINSLPSLLQGNQDFSIDRPLVFLCLFLEIFVHGDG